MTSGRHSSQYYIGGDNFHQAEFQWVGRLRRCSSYPRTVVHGQAERHEPRGLGEELSGILERGHVERPMVRGINARALSVSQLLPATLPVNCSDSESTDI